MADGIAYPYRDGAMLQVGPGTTFDEKSDELYHNGVRYIRAEREETAAAAAREAALEESGMRLSEVNEINLRLTAAQITGGDVSKARTLANWIKDGQ